MSIWSIIFNIGILVLIWYTLKELGVFSDIRKDSAADIIMKVKYLQYIEELKNNGQINIKDYKALKQNIT